jgi:DNA-binding CsgD family transcriptional regulator
MLLRGRDGLIDDIVSALTATDIRAVTLHGPSGVGKTRLAAEAAQRLDAQAWSTLRLSARTSLSALPLGGLAPLFAGQGAGFLAVSSDPVALLNFTTARLRSLAGTGRILLVIDDISSMDTLSVSVVSQLLDSGAAKLLATVGEGAPVPDALLQMWSQSTARRVDLEPLTADDCGAIVAELLGGPVARRSVESLTRAAGGNPLFLRELTRGAVAASTLVEVGGVWQLLGEAVSTDALQQVIGRRLAGMTAVQRDVVERLAVCVVLPVAELVMPGARDALRRLEADGLVEVRDDKGTLVAALALPQYETLTKAALSLLRVEDILLEQADIAELAARGPEDALRVAVWRLGAGHPSEPQLLNTGARLAQLTHDHAQAAKLSRAAITAGYPGAAPYLVLADAQRRMGQAEQAFSTAEHAAVVDAETPTSDLLTAQIVMTRALIRHDRPGGTDEAMRMLRQAEIDLPEHADMLALRRAMILFTIERAGDALALVEPHLDMPARTPAERVQLAMAAAMPLAAAGRMLEAEREVGVILDAIPAGLDRAFALFTAASATLVAGTATGAHEYAIGALYESIQHDDEISTRYAELLLGHALLELGQIDAAIRWIRDAVGGAEAFGPRNLLRVSRASLAVALVYAGQLDDAEAILDSLVDSTSEGNLHSSVARALIEAARGNEKAAIRSLERLADQYEADGTLYLAASVLHHVARIGGAQSAAPRLEAIAARGDSTLFHMRARYARALADSSVDALAEAGEGWHSIGAELFAAEAFAQAGALARSRGNSQASLALFRRATSLAQSCVGARTPILRLALTEDVLTKREREIVELASTGMTSQEIASALFLSARTVDNHLQSSYGKLGISGRRDLLRKSGV